MIKQDPLILRSAVLVNKNEMYSAMVSKMKYAKKCRSEIGQMKKRISNKMGSKKCDGIVILMRGQRQGFCKKTITNGLKCRRIQKDLQG